MIVDPILETCIAGGVDTRLTLKDNRSASFHFTTGWSPHQKCPCIVAPADVSAVLNLLLWLRSDYDLSTRS